MFVELIMFYRSFIGFFFVWDIVWCFFEYSGERDRFKCEWIKLLLVGDIFKVLKDGLNCKIEFYEMVVGDEKNVEMLMEEGSIWWISIYEMNSEREEYLCD